MAIKHVEEYYDQICNLYMEMKDNIKSLEEDLEKDMVSPEMVDNLKEMVKPIMENYERWSYMMYLLHKPKREGKERVYQKRNKKLLSQLKKSNSTQSVLKEMDEVNKNIKRIASEN